MISFRLYLDPICYAEQDMTKQVVLCFMLLGPRLRLMSMGQKLTFLPHPIQMN